VFARCGSPWAYGTPARKAFVANDRLAVCADTKLYFFSVFVTLRVPLVSSVKMSSSIFAH